MFLSAFPVFIQRLPRVHVDMKGCASEDTPHFVSVHLELQYLHAYTYGSHCMIRLSLTTELVKWATESDAVMSTVNFENGKQCLEDTTETLSCEKTSREGESPKVEGLPMR